MNKEEFERIKNVWNAIESIERIEDVFETYPISTNFAVTLRQTPSNEQYSKTCYADLILTPELNKVALGALTSYKEQLKAEMEALRFCACEGQPDDTEAK